SPLPRTWRRRPGPFDRQIHLHRARGQSGSHQPTRPGQHFPRGTSARRSTGGKNQRRTQFMKLKKEISTTGPAARDTWLKIFSVALLALALLQTHAFGADSEATVPTVAVSKVTREDLSQNLVCEAELRPYQEVDLHAKVAGYLENITVDIGDSVTAGQLL